MFDVEFKGGNTVVFSSKKSTAVIDPKLSLVGLKDMKLKDVVEIATEPRFALKAQDAQLLVEGPGEYEVGDFSIRGMAAQRHIDTPDQEKLATIYRLETGDVRIGILGNIAPRLSDDQLEFLGVVDLLIVPVGGGGYTLDATSASAIVRQIDPKAVIPVHFADEALKFEVPQDSVDVFVKELGAPVEEHGKLKVKSAISLPQTLTVLHLARS